MRVLYPVLVAVAIFVLPATSSKRCSYTFRVPVEDMHAGCATNEGGTGRATLPERALASEPQPQGGAGTGGAGASGLDEGLAQKLLESIDKLIQHQNQLMDVSKAEKMVSEMNDTVNEQDKRYNELVLRTRMLSSQLNILTSGYTKRGGTDQGIFPNYKGITNKYIGCPLSHAQRIHEIAPIKKIFEEIIRVVPHSCFEWKLMGFKQKGSYQIDPDGIEGAAPFDVDCIISSTEVITMVKHNFINRTHILGYESPGSYVADIEYGGLLPEQLKALIGSSTKCEQFLKYECKGSTLSNEGWWVSIDGEKQNHWAGGSPVLGGCACNVDKTCTNRGACNCDSNDDSRWNQDAGYIRDMSLLPVTRVQFGDTGSPDEEAYFTLGPLRCYSEAVSPYSTTNAFLPLETWPPFPAFCDFQGWMVIMRHNLYGSVDFDMDFDSYRTGFGDLNHDFWLGLDKIYQVTNQENKWYALQISIDNGMGVKYFAKYDYFKISNDTEQYRLHVSGYSGTAPDEMHNMDGMTFTARDRDGDNWQGGNCAEIHGGGWWWYDCGYVMLTSGSLGWGGLTDVESVEMKIKVSEFN